MSPNMTFMSAKTVFDSKKFFPAFKRLGVSCCLSAVLHEHFLVFFFLMQEWVSWRWVAHTGDLCLQTSRRQLGPSVSPFPFQPIWLGFSTLLVPWGPQMDCCQGRWAWPAGGGGGSGDGGVTPLLPLTATSWLLDPWQTLPQLLASCLPQVNPWGRSSLNTPSPHLVPSCVFWLLCWQNSYKWLGLALIAVLMHVEWTRPIGLFHLPTQLSADT